MLNGLKVAEGESDKQLRPMDRTDWMAFAGAENFDDGSEPMIAYVDVTQWPSEHRKDTPGSQEPVDGVVVLADKNGVAVSGTNAAFVLFGPEKEQAIEIGNKIVQSAPVNWKDLVRQGFEPINFPNDNELQREAAEEEPGRIPQNASVKKAARPDNFDYKTELTTPDGYEIQSYNPFADPKNPRRFSVWPPEGNAVGDYSSLEEANLAIEQWKQFGDPELLKRDGGARFKVRKASATKTAGNFKGAWTNEPQPGPEELQPVNDTIAFLKSDPSQWYAIRWHGYAGDEGTYDMVGLPAEPQSVNDIAAVLDETPTQIARASEDGYYSYSSKDQLLAFSNLSLTKPTETYGARNEEEYFHYIQELPDFDDVYAAAMKEDEGAPEEGHEASYLECPDCGQRIDTWDAEQGSYNPAKLDEHRVKEHQKKGSVKTAGPMDVESPESSFVDTDHKMRPFERTDWYGWAGAESFEGGQGQPDIPPYIAYAKVVNWPEIDEYNFENENPIDEVAVIVDANGVSINGSNGAYQIDMGSKETNLSEANQMLLHQPIDVNQLKDQGWEEINIFPMEEQQKRRQENMMRDQQKKNTEIQQADPTKQRELESGRKPMEASAKKKKADEEKENWRDEDFPSNKPPLNDMRKAVQILTRVAKTPEQREALDYLKRAVLALNDRIYKEMGVPPVDPLMASVKTADSMSEGVDPNLVNDINEQTRQDEERMYRELEQEGQEDRELHEQREGWPDSDEETTESTISHIVNVLQDSSMSQEARIARAHSELKDWLLTH
jgi:hypothetical protein